MHYKINGKLYECVELPTINTVSQYTSSRKPIRGVVINFFDPDPDSGPDLDPVVVPSDGPQETAKPPSEKPSEPSEKPSEPSEGSSEFIGDVIINFYSK